MIETYLRVPTPRVDDVGPDGDYSSDGVGFLQHWEQRTDAFLTVVGEGVVERSVTPAELNKKDMVLTW